LISKVVQFLIGRAHNLLNMISLNFIDFQYIQCSTPHHFTVCEVPCVLYHAPFTTVRTENKWNSGTVG